MTAADLAQLLGGPLFGEPLMPVTGFATDNRDWRPGEAFMAIKGERVDGHDFIPDGALAIVERPVREPQIVVPNLVPALSGMAATLRESFPRPVIGITGSAGKTTAKEFAAAALSPLGSVVKTPGNRNTEYTAPLLWAEVTGETKAVVVEMAMRGVGQIAHLARFTRPTVGLVTNIGYAHLLQVGSREGIARAKAELLQALPADGVAVLWAEDEFLPYLRGESPAAVATFGFSEGATCRITDYRAMGWTEATIRGTVHGKRFDARLPAIGRHVALSAAAAILIATRLGVEIAAAAAALWGVGLPPMRMEIRNLGDVTILLDAYNASPPSMIAAIETLAEMPVEGRRRAVIGEMRELGEFSEQAHVSVAEALRRNGIRDVAVYGAGTKPIYDLLAVRSMASLGDVRAFLAESRPGDAVLIKGSRALELEKALS